MTSNATKSEKTKASKRFYVSSLVMASLFIALSVILKMTFEIYFMPELRVNFCSVPIMLSGIFLGPVWGLAVGGIADILNYLIKPGGALHYGFTLTSALSGFIPGLIFYLAKKRRNINYSALNIINFVILIGGMVYLLRANGIITIADNSIFIKGSLIPWYIIVVILAIFVLYSSTLILLLRKKETNQMTIPIDKIFFAVTGVEVLCDLILNAIFLSDLYGMAVMALLPMRFLKILVVIPIFSFVCFILCNIIARYKLQKK